MTTNNEIKVGTVVRYWDYTYERYTTGKVDEIDVRVTWRRGELGVRIGGVTRTYADVEVPNE